MTHFKIISNNVVVAEYMTDMPAPKHGDHVVYRDFGKPLADNAVPEEEIGVVNYCLYNFSKNHVKIFLVGPNG